MASIRKQKKTWFACIRLGNGTRTQLSTGIKDVGSPAERADAKRKADIVAAAIEEAAVGNKTETQIRKAITDLYAKVNGKPNSVHGLADIESAALEGVLCAMERW